LLPEDVIEWKRHLKLPNADAATIPKEKVTAYLLSDTHRIGKTKAAFFGKHGFTADNWQVLERALREHAKKHVVTRAEGTAYGTRYVVDGDVTAPDGTSLNVRSVWFINRGTTTPRFATAHPLKRKAK
jgi:hypothetical protein